MKSPDQRESVMFTEHIRRRQQTIHSESDTEEKNLSMSKIEDKNSDQNSFVNEEIIKDIVHSPTDPSKIRSADETSIIESSDVCKSPTPYN